MAVERWLFVLNDEVINVVESDGPPGYVPDDMTVEPDPGRVGPGYLRVNGEWVAPPPPVPTRATNADWKIALIKMGRLQEIEEFVEQMRASGTPDGLILYQRYHYANHVYRDDLLALAPLMGFSQEEIDASLLLAGAD